MKRTLKTKYISGRNYNILALPGTNFFKFEIINKRGAHIEKAYEDTYQKEVYGLAHLVEHLSFRTPRDFSSTELLEFLKSEGNYNASTDFSKINYWFQTTMENYHKGILAVLNIAYNNLKNISEEEFNIEKNVVLNEIKRYNDDDQNMFYFNVYPNLCGFKKYDNILGSAEIIDKCTLQDAIILKDILLKNNDVIYNIIYDPEILTENEIIQTVENEISTFKLPVETVEEKEYYNSFEYAPRLVNNVIENDSEQSMVAFNFNTNFNKVVTDIANDYLLEYSKSSLDDIIREKNGLTYSVNLYNYHESVFGDVKNFTTFITDVSNGDEDLLLKLFKKSINESVQNWNTEEFNRLIKTKKLKRSLNLLDQKNYGYWLFLSGWEPEIFKELKDKAELDLTDTYEELDKIFFTEENIREYLINFRDLVNSDNFSIIKNGDFYENR